jgi:hypothetical protein
MRRETAENPCLIRPNDKYAGGRNLADQRLSGNRHFLDCQSIRESGTPPPDKGAHSEEAGR